MFRIKELKRAIAFAMTTAMMLSVVGCGNGAEQEAIQDTAEPVSEENEAAEAAEIETGGIDEAAEEPEATEEPVALTYVEENGLEYTDEWGFEITGYALNALDHADHVDVDVWFEISDISVEDAEEDGFKVVTVKQNITGYRWFDGREKKTDVLFPSVAVADSYTGLMVPSNTTHYDEVLEGSTDIEWEDETWHISYTEDAKWDMENEWKPMSDGNFAAWLTCHDTLTITIHENYDGLVLVLPPISLLTESVESGEHILDYWGENGKDSYLFNPLEMAKELEEEAEASATATSAVTNNTKTDKAAASTPTTTPKQEETKTQAVKEETKPTHTHSYNGTVTANPTCGNNGTKTFTCSCGDSYTESIPATGHQWETRTEQIVHPSQGHMEYSNSEDKNSFMCNCCHSTFDTIDALCDHQVANNDTCNNYGWTMITESGGQTSTWVVDVEEWTETVNYSVCTVCGAKQ